MGHEQAMAALLNPAPFAHKTRGQEGEAKPFGDPGRDPGVIAVGKHLEADHSGFRIVQGRFSSLDEIAEAAGFSDVAGVVLDIGVSSMQVDQAERGFSFRHDGPLDMRMGRDGASAGDTGKA